MTQTKEQKAELKAAQAAAPSDEELTDIARRVPPLVRDAEHSFVPQEETDAETDPELLNPDLTGKDIADVEADFVADEGGDIKITRPGRIKGDYTRSTAFTESDLERLSDEQVEKLVKKAGPRFHPSRLGLSDRQRSPNFRTPAAGAGSWPVNESQLPAVLPSDPPVEDADDRNTLSDNTFTGATGFSRAKDGSLKRKGLNIGKKEVAAAAALYLRLRQQFPEFTTEQLGDEFELQWLSLRSGAEQSHRAGPEMSSAGQTAAGDARTTETNLGELRRSSDRAFEADPEQVPPEVAGAGAPSTNEPASTAVDQAKKPSGETAAADKQAAAEVAKFDHDGDGKVGGSKPKTS